jgi:hypothetical protein
LLGRDINELANFFTMLARKGLTYTCFGTIRYVTEEKMKLASETGMKSIFFGIETHEGLRKTVGKWGLNGALKDDEIIKALDTCRRYGIRTASGYIIGFPWETREDMEKTVDAMVNLPVDYPSLNTLTIHPESPIWTWREKNIELFPDLIDKPFTHVDRDRWPEEPEGLPCPHPYISKAEMSEIKKQAHKRAFTDKKRIERLMRMATTNEERNHTQAAINDFLHLIGGK